MRWPLCFCGLCVFLDEVSTFSILALGGWELNPRISRIIEAHPLLWTLMDIVLLLSFVVIGRMLKFKGASFLPVGVGVGRLVCFVWNVAQIMLWSLSWRRAV